MLNVVTHFMKGDGELHLGLKIKLPAKYDDRTVREAVVDPFVEAYDKRHPDYPASKFRPFSRVKVLVWAGPLHSSADHYREKDRPWADDIQEAEKPINCLLDIDEPVSVLRKRAHNKLKPTVEVELVAAESTAIVLRSVPSNSLLAPGEKLMAMLTDKESDPEDMHKLVDTATAAGELAYLGLTQARDRHGRNALHMAVTRGDLTLCRKLMRRRQDIFAMDTNRDMALHVACLAGRQLIVKDLLEMGAPLHEKNRDLMAPLNLSVVDEGHGDGEVVRMLVEAGCDIDGKCWDVTPLMAAAAGGHYWALEVLLELGADTEVRNGYEMMALDYARDMDSAQLIHDFMQGFFLSDDGTLKRQAASRERTAESMRKAGINGTHGEAKGPRLFQAARAMPLDEAFAALELPPEQLSAFRKCGEHYADVRRKWRHVVLHHHPDKVPANLTSEAEAEHTAAFQKAMAAFEAIDRYYAEHHAPAAPPMGPDPGSVPPQPSPPPPTGDGPGAAPDGLDSTRKGAAAGGDGDGSEEVGRGEAAATAVSPPDTSTRSTQAKDADESKVSDGAKEATLRAARPLLYKRRVRIVGLQAKPEYNGRCGVASAFDRQKMRYAVSIEGSDEKLKVREANLQLAPQETEEDEAVAID